MYMVTIIDSAGIQAVKSIANGKLFYPPKGTEIVVIPSVTEHWSWL